MLFYIVFFIIVTLCLAFNKYGKKYGFSADFFSNLATLIICLVALLRFDVGADYPTYYRYLIYELDTVYWEPLSSLFYYIALYSKWPQLFFILFGLPTYVLIFQTCKRFSVNYEISILVFFSLFYLSSFSIVRQYLAISICFYGIRYVFSSSFLKYLITICIAMLFHYSALVALFIYPAYRYLKFKYIPLFFLLFIIVAESVLKMVSMSPYGKYIEFMELYNESGKYISLFYLLLYGVILVFCRKVASKKMSLIIFCYIPLFSVLAYSISNRLGIYFLIYFCLLIPLVVKRNAPLKVLFCFVCVIYFFFTLWYTSYTNSNTPPYIPYQFCF